MTWADVISQVSERSGLPRAEVRAVLDALVRLVLDQAREGQEVPLKGVGRIGARWLEPRTIRTLQARRKVMMDGRFVPRFRPSEQLRDAVLSRSPQHWRNPAHQSAWRSAETLVGDLALYHKDKVPKVPPNATPEEIQRLCEAAFGPLWTRVTHTYDTQTPADVRADQNYLILAARRKWTSPQP